MRDVIVIGSGPAGSTAARLLAGRGLDVLVFDREVFPRVKPCGGGLTTRALALLPPNYEDYICARPTEWIFEGRAGGEIQTRSVHTDQPYSHIVHRASFDQWLATEAERQGATVHTGEAVVAVDEAVGGRGYTVQTKYGTYHARYLVGADGGRGISARLLGFSRPRNGAAVEVEVPVAPEQFRQWQDSVTINIEKYPWGYAWVIPRRPVLNLGVGSFRAHRLPLRPLLQEWAESKLGPGALNSLGVLAHPLPYRYQPARLAKSRSVLVGDAGGLMDTLSAEGIYSALMSATLAAEAIADAAPNNGPLQAYDKKLQQQLWPSLRDAGRIGLLFYPLPGFWTKLFVSNPAMIEQYLRVAQGAAPYSSLLRMGQQAVLKKAHLRPGRDKGTLSH